MCTSGLNDMKDGEGRLRRGVVVGKGATSPQEDVPIGMTPCAETIRPAGRFPGSAPCYRRASRWSGAHHPKPAGPCIESVPGMLTWERGGEKRREMISDGSPLTFPLVVAL